MSSNAEANTMKQESKRELKPKLRFPGFRDMEGWKIKQLGHLCKIRTGKKDANEGAENGLYPFFTCAENHIFSNSYSFDTEAILVAGNANVGQTKYYKGKFEAYQRTYVLTDFADIAVQYLYAFLSANLKSSLLGQVQTSAMSYIKLPMLQEYELAIPPTLNEQQKVAECLTSLDALIAAHGQKLDALKAHKTGLMQQLFPREGETLPRLRFPEFQDEPDWAIKKLGDFSKVVASGDLEPQRFSPIESGQFRYPVYSNAVVNEGLYGYYSIHKYLKNSITITARGSLGVAFMRNQDFMGIGRLLVVSDLHEANPYFLNECWNHLATIAQEVTSIPQLTAVTARATSLPIPSIAEQQKIADCLSSLDELLTAQTQKLDALKTHKKGLMQQLFPSTEEVEA